MSWNYRITRETARGVTYYALREVYYDDGGRPEGWSADPVRFTGDTPQDIVEDLLLAASAWSRGVLDLDTRKTVSAFLNSKGLANHAEREIQ